MLASPIGHLIDVPLGGLPLTGVPLTGVSLIDVYLLYACLSYREGDKVGQQGQ